MDKEICKVNCNVSDCAYNQKGCMCNREQIDVTNQSGTKHHCGSYCKK